MEPTTCWSVWLCIWETVEKTEEKLPARLFRAFITAVRLADEVGACEAVAKAADRLVRPVASDWLSPGAPNRPLSWLNRLPIVLYWALVPPADSISCIRNWLATRWTLAMFTPINWPPTDRVC